jgi:dTDP-4-dehydrorhamnose reductase
MPNSDPILLIGSQGQLGQELEQALKPLGEVAAHGRSEFDLLADPKTLREMVRAVRPRLIVNAAAYTAVDRAETDAAAAYGVNGAAPEVLAQAARDLGIGLVHYSTDYVFDGSKEGPYLETDAPNPLGVYGKSKLAGEQAVAASGAAYLILRSSWIYASHGKNFLLTMTKLAREKPELRVIADQFGAPTWARHIAEASAQILARCSLTESTRTEGIREASGVYHLTAAGRVSWHGYAETIVREMGLVTPVRAISTAEYPLPAPRPKNSVLSCAKLAARFGIALPPWEQGVKQCLEELAAAQASQ